MRQSLAFEHEPEVGSSVLVLRTAKRLPILQFTYSRDLPIIRRDLRPDRGSNIAAQGRA